MAKGFDHEDKTISSVTDAEGGYYVGSDGVIEIREHSAGGEGDKWFYDVHYQSGTTFDDSPIQAAAAEIVEGIRRFNELGERDIMLPPVENVAAILSKHLGSAAVGEQWLPIETAPRNEEWCVVGKISDGKLLWWYRAMFWRRGWHTARSYDTQVVPSHWLPLAAPAATPTSPEDVGGGRST